MGQEDAAGASRDHLPPSLGSLLHSPGPSPRGWVWALLCIFSAHPSPRALTGLLLSSFLWAVGGPAGQTAGSSKCQVSWQQLLTHPPRPPVLLTDKEKGQLPPDEVLDEAVPEYRAPGRKSLLEIQQLDPDDESLVNYKQALLGPEPPAVGMPMPWAGVGRVG